MPVANKAVHYDLRDRGIDEEFLVQAGRPLLG